MSLLTVAIIGLVLLILAIILFLMAGKSLIFGNRIYFMVSIVLSLIGSCMLVYSIAVWVLRALIN